MLKQIDDFSSLSHRPPLLNVVGHIPVDKVRDLDDVIVVVLWVGGSREEAQSRLFAHQLEGSEINKCINK